MCDGFIPKCLIASRIRDSVIAGKFFLCLGKYTLMIFMCGQLNLLPFTLSCVLQESPKEAAKKCCQRRLDPDGLVCKLIDESKGTASV
jgi:hypothetical protein